MEKRTGFFSGKSVKETTGSLGKFVTHSAPLSVAADSCPHLFRLAEAIDIPQTKLVDERIRSLELTQLEMLEAELRHQGILLRPDNDQHTLAQYAQYDINVWRWRAQRLHFPSTHLQFRIDVPAYLLSKAGELVPELQNTNSSTNGENLLSRRLMKLSSDHTRSHEQDIRYFDFFAAYLMGNFSAANDRYQRGLNLVLQSLLKTQTEQNKNSALFLLPLSNDDFIRTLRSSVE